MREKAGQGSYVICDYPACKARFATVSDATVVRAQAAATGWTHVSGKKVTDAKGIAISKQKVDLCPACTFAHGPKPMVMR